MTEREHTKKILINEFFGTALLGAAAIAAGVGLAQGADKGTGLRWRIGQRLKNAVVGPGWKGSGAEYFKERQDRIISDAHRKIKDKLRVSDADYIKLVSEQNLKNHSISLAKRLQQHGEDPEKIHYDNAQAIIDWHEGGKIGTKPRRTNGRLDKNKAVHTTATSQTKLDQIFHFNPEIESFYHKTVNDVLVPANQRRTALLADVTDYERRKRQTTDNVKSAIEADRQKQIKDLAASRVLASRSQIGNASRTVMDYLRTRI